MARRRTRRLRLFLATLSVLLLVTTAATVWAVQAQQATGRQRNNAIAQKALAQALELRANNPALALQLGLAWLAQKDTVRAMDQFHQARRIDPSLRPSGA